jgi:hypothetical protein
VAPYLGLDVDREAINSVTRGLVGDTSFAVLPEVVPLVCFLLTLGFQIVSNMLSLKVDCSSSSAVSHPAPIPANLGDIHWCSDSLWIRFFPVRLARP